MLPKGNPSSARTWAECWRGREGEIIFLHTTISDFGATEIGDCTMKQACANMAHENASVSATLTQQQTLEAWLHLPQLQYRGACPGVGSHPMCVRPWRQILTTVTTPREGLPARSSEHQAVFVPNCRLRETQLCEKDAASGVVPPSPLYLTYCQNICQNSRLLKTLKKRHRAEDKAKFLQRRSSLPEEQFMI